MTLDASSAIVLIATIGTVRPKMFVVEFQCGLSHSSAQRWKIGCQSGMRARRKKYVVKSAKKNIASVETKRMQAHMPCEKRPGCASRPVSLVGRRSRGRSRRPRTIGRSSVRELNWLVPAVAGGIARGDVRTSVIDEPGREPEDEDHRADDDEDGADEDAEREDRHTETDDRG